MKKTGITHSSMVKALETIAPLNLAEEWDNVGLVVRPKKLRRVESVLLTIDLTEGVFQEARQKKASFIVAYHPPIFEGLKQLDGQRALDRIVSQAMAESISVYSPHTALDAVDGGVNDWLASGLGPGTCTAWNQDEEASGGTARIHILDKPAGLPAMIQRVKKHLKLKTVRLAKATTGAKRIKTIALCAGAGSSSFEGADADLFLTGEMRHHDILAALSKGTHVLLNEHTHTERGYLPLLQKRLRKALGADVDVLVSRKDREPVDTV